MSILSLLEQIEFGHFAEELNTVQQEVVHAVRDTNKKGSITITLEFNPENHGQMTIKADFKRKCPSCHADPHSFSARQRVNCNATIRANKS